MARPPASTQIGNQPPPASQPPAVSTVTGVTQPANVLQPGAPIPGASIPGAPVPAAQTEGVQPNPTAGGATTAPTGLPPGTPGAQMAVAAAAPKITDQELADMAAEVGKSKIPDAAAKAAFIQTLAGRPKDAVSDFERRLAMEYAGHAKTGKAPDASVQHQLVASGQPPEATKPAVENESHMSHPVAPLSTANADPLLAPKKT